MTSFPPPVGEDEKRAFIGSLSDNFLSQAARACRAWAAPRPEDARSVCNAALARALGAMYRAFDREREGAASFCRRAFAVAVRDELVERARTRATLKRGGGRRELRFDTVAEVLEAPNDPLTELKDAIEDVRRVRPIRADIVNMRVFGGFLFREIAEELGMDETTVRKQFKLAQAQLWRSFGAGP